MAGYLSFGGCFVIAGAVGCARVVTLPARQIEVRSSVAAPSASADVRLPTLSAATHFACAISAKHVVSCWGRNDAGQLGDDTRSTQALPVENLVGSARSIHAGESLTCSIADSGKVSCWGGERAPFDVPGIEAAKDVAPGYNLVCALERAGKVVCTALRSRYDTELAEDYRSFPIRAPDDIVSIATTRREVCLVRKSGELACFLNEPLKLSEKDESERSTPIEAKALSGVSKVMQLVGVYDRFCAAFRDGTVGCWQDASSGGASKAELTRVSGIDTAVRLAIGSTHGCAVEREGHVKCWGLNVDGKLGTQELPPNDHFAVRVSGVEHAEQVAVGDDFSCASRRSKVVCWGSSENGVLGNGETLEATEPREVKGVTNASQVVAGRGYSCALTKGGVWCWGTGSMYQGNPGRPIRMANLSGAQRITMQSDTLCAYGDNGVMGCIRDPQGAPESLVPVVPHGVEGARVIVPGHDDEWVALTRDGKVALYTLGLVAMARSEYIVAVKGITDAIDVAGNRNVVCAILRSGDVKCAFAEYPTLDQFRPKRFSVKPLPSVHDATHIACSLDVLSMSCSLTTRRGKLINFNLGMLNQTLFEDPFVNDVASVSVGFAFRCAILKSGQVACSGYNSSGQLGAGNLASSRMYTLTNTKDLPVSDWQPVVGMSNAVSVAAGADHACAALADGRVYCWGANGAQQLGSGPLPFTTEANEVRGLELAH